MINAFGVENAIIYITSNEAHLVHLNQDYVIFPTSDDLHIGLYKVNEDNLKISMVDGNSYGISPKGINHEFISRLILHNYFLREEELFQKYIKECNQDFYFFAHTNFLISNKPFLRLEVNYKNQKNKHFAAFKNRDVNYEIQGYKENLTKEQDDLIKRLTDKNILTELDIHLASILENESSQKI